MFRTAMAQHINDKDANFKHDFKTYDETFLKLNDLSDLNNKYIENYLK